MNNSLTEFKDELAEQLYSMTKDQAVRKGICINCKEYALSKCYSAAGRREYYISGLCEECFDNIFNEEYEM